MISLQIEATIHRPVDTVFDRLADIDSYNDWMSFNGLFRRSRQTSPGAPGKGTTFSDRTRVGPVCGEITEFLRPEKIGFRQTIYWFGIPVGETRPAYRLTGSGGDTAVHHHAEGDFYGLLKPFEPVILKYARAERKRTLKALKRSLESGQ